MTLPLIYTLNKVSKQERNKIVNTIKKHHHNKEKVGEVIQCVIENGGILYAEQKMELFKDKALEILRSYPKNDARESLESLLVYTIERKK